MNSQLQRGIDAISKWSNRPGNKTQLLDRPLEDLREDLADTSLAAARGIASSLDFMSTWHLVRGANDVLNDDPNGWNDVGRAYREYSLSAEMFVRAFHRDPRGRRKKCALVLEHYAIRNIAIGLMLGDERVCSWLGGDLNARVEEGSMGHYPNTPYREFIVTLWQIYRNAALDNAPVDRKELGPYRDVFAAWTDEEGLGHVLEQLCDYHLEMSVENGDDSDQDFLDEPLMVFPVEIHALRTVRARLHLATPLFHHDLMETQLGKLPSDVGRQHDALLDSVKMWVKENLS